MKTVQETEQALDNLISERKAEIKTFQDLMDQRGTSIPALFSIFYKFIQNPSSVSVDTFKRMIDTDDTIGSGVDFLTTALASRIGKYQHKSDEITQWVNARLDSIEGGFFNFKKEMFSATWAGYYVGEKCWHNTDAGFVIDRIVPFPPSSVLFETDRQGRIEEDGILQYQRNINPFGISQGFNFFGGIINSGFSFAGAGLFGDLKPDPFSKLGDLPYPLRTANSFAYLSIRIPKQKCVIYSFDAQGKMGNPYGRSLLRRCFNAYVCKHQIVQMMLKALDRKGTPLMVVYAAPNATVRDPRKVVPGQNERGKTVGMDAAKAASQAFENIHNDTVITLPGKKGQIYDVDPIPMDPNADQFIMALEFFNKAELRALLIPALIFGGGDGGGAYALGQEHGKTFDKICDGIGAGAKDVLVHDIVRELLMYNFPESAWKKDGLGDFSKLELTRDEKEKEQAMLQFGIDNGAVDMNEIADYNKVREFIGFEAVDKVPEIKQPGLEEDESGREHEEGDGKQVEGEESTESDTGKDAEQQHDEEQDVFKG